MIQVWWVSDPKEMNVEQLSSIGIFISKGVCSWEADSLSNDLLSSLFKVL